MTKAMAYKILGITPGTDFTEIKKKYRQLMHRVHPDAEAFSTRAYDFTAQEINEAYDLSLIHISEPTRRTPISYAVFCLKKKKHCNPNSHTHLRAHYTRNDLV